MSLRERLKVETREQHKRLEAELNLTRGDFEQADLITLLERFYGYYVPCERQLGMLPADLASQFSERMKTSLLRDDLRSFGRTNEAIDTLPTCAVFTADTAGKTLGRWYVLEGSTLGGQLLAKHFEQRFQLPDGQGVSFFRSYGQRVGPMWRSYCELLDAVTSTSVEDEAIAAANDTFVSMALWLNR